MRVMLGPSVRMILRRPAGALLVAGEVAVSVVLLVHLVVMNRHLHDSLVADTGLGPDSLYVVDLDDEHADRLRGLPGVRVAAQVERPPHERTQLSLPFTAGTRRARAWLLAGDSALPDALGLRIVDGAALGDDDGEAEPALITAALARDLFGGSAVGRRFSTPLRSRPLEVRGVVADVLIAVAWSHDANHGVFTRATHFARRAPWLVRATDDFATTAPSLVTARSLSIVSLRDRLRDTHANVSGVLRLALGVVLMLLFVGTAGAGTMVGLFVTARTREIGLRRALGARRGEVVGQLVAEAVLIGLVGVALGVASSFAVAWVTETPYAALDPALLGGAAAAVLAIAALSSYVPARRAARIEPAVAGKIQ